MLFHSDAHFVCKNCSSYPQRAAHTYRGVVLLHSSVGRWYGIQQGVVIACPGGSCQSSAGNLVYGINPGCNPDPNCCNLPCFPNGPHQVGPVQQVYNPQSVFYCSAPCSHVYRVPYATPFPTAPYGAPYPNPYGHHTPQPRMQRHTQQRCTQRRIQRPTLRRRMDL
ncbi:hypothetical protein BX661DRAFT_169785 [Kickxella alabastrina]|uniref:uncharacterized protein n=1 Tax=Kickxella alabastrina TaxID=61397 RepID=UPI0022203932|nr:uncharacterized protein BX661DRAFT_169785 [Kickxella alabastrina]KAI7831928.1 hypothetical protein BX661DRAFT_169785 [Kickxella alabastrina]